jgi:hypothetical protein
MISTLDDVTTSLPVRKLFGIPDNVVIAIFSETRRVSGWTVAKTTLAERVRPALLKMGPAVLLGMSTDQPSTSHIPRALEESRLALDFATVAERVVQYSEIPIRQIMLRAIKQQGDISLPAWIASGNVACICRY